eukprot:jgi/Mesvir1/20565/Mv06236-RA.1
MGSSATNASSHGIGQMPAPTGTPCQWFDGVPMVLFHHLPLLDRVRLRGVSRGFRSAVDDSWASLTRLSGNDLAAVDRRDSWLCGLLWLLPHCPHLRAFVAGKSWLYPYFKEDGLEMLVGDESEDVLDDGGDISIGGMLAVAENWHQHLSHLDVSDGGVEGLSDVHLAAVLKRCPSLETLEVARNSLVTDVSMIALAHCPRLRHLDVGDNACVTGDGIRAVAACCPRLRHLDVMSGCASVTDGSIESIGANCPGLQTLRAAGCAIGDAAVSAIRLQLSGSADAPAGRVRRSDRCQHNRHY